jgi:hypothetical protein
MFELASARRTVERALAEARRSATSASVSELADLVGECQELVNVLGAVQTVAMAHLAATEDVALEDGTVIEQHRGLGHERLDAPALVSGRLGVSDHVASHRVSDAVQIMTRHRDVLAAMGRGRLDSHRAGVVCDELIGADPEICTAVGELVSPHLGAEPSGPLRRRVRAALAAVDESCVRERAARARDERHLSRAPGVEPGVDEWRASLPTERAASAWSVVDSVARRYVRERRNTTLDQARADALVDLIEARATGTVDVQLLVPVSECLRHGSAVDSADVLVPVNGVGSLSHVSRAWLDAVIDGAGLADPGSTGPQSATPVTARTTVVLCDDATGAVASTPLGPARPRPLMVESDSHDPPVALAALVRARDQRCRFPGCSISARFCDLDHVIAHPAGRTTAGNLMCLCRRHHRVKQRLRWSVVLGADGTVTWTDPTGLRRATHPERMLPLVVPDPRPTLRVARPRSSPVTPGAAVTSALEDQLDHCRRVSRLPSRRQRADALQRDIAAVPVVETHHWALRGPVVAPSSHRGRGRPRPLVDPPF